MILTREQSMSGKGRVYKTVKFEELDGELRLGSLSAGAALDLNDLKEQLAKGEPVEKKMMVLMIVDAVVDEKGAPVFDEASAAAFLLKISSETLLQISRETPKSAASVGAVPLGNQAASQGA